MFSAYGIMSSTHTHSKDKHETCFYLCNLLSSHANITFNKTLQQTQWDKTGTHCIQHTLDQIRLEVFGSFLGLRGGGCFGRFCLMLCTCVDVCVLVSLQIMCLSIGRFDLQVKIKPLKRSTRAWGMIWKVWKLIMWIRFFLKITAMVT